MKNNVSCFIPEEERKKLILLFLRKRQGKGANEHEILEILNWAGRVRAEQAILDSVLAGKLTVDLKGTEPVFQEVKA